MRSIALPRPRLILTLPASGWYTKRLLEEVCLPLYEYQCKKCKTHFEKIRKFSDPPLTKCENCGGKLEQLVSSPAFQFKGSGWYVTDYARKSESTKPAAEASKEKDKSGNGSDSKKSSETAKSSESPKSSKTPAATKPA